MEEQRRLEKNPVGELINDLAAKVSSESVDFLGVDEEKAKAFGQIIADRITEEWGGQSFYLPMNMVRKLKTRDDQIFADYTGDNIAELCMKYKLSRQAIYRIIKKVRSLR